MATHVYAMARKLKSLVQPGRTRLDLVHFQHPRISDTFSSISGIDLSPVWCYPILIGNETPEFPKTFDH